MGEINLKRRINERKFGSGEELPDGGRRYIIKIRKSMIITRKDAARKIGDYLRHRFIIIAGADIPYEFSKGVHVLEHPACYCR